MLGAVLALSGLALSGGSALLEHRAQNAAARANRVAAESNFRTTIADLRARLAEEQTATALRKDQASLDVSRALGTNRAAIAASGLSGTSIGLLLNDIQAQGAQFNFSADRNLAATARQIGRLEEQAAVIRDNQIAGIQAANPLLTGLKIGSGVLDAAVLYRGLQP